MDADEYTLMDRLESRMWWYRALHALIRDLLARHAVPDTAVLADIGCGTGGLLAYLGRSGRSGLVGVEIAAPAARLAAAKSGAAVVVGSADALPLGTATLAAATSADVLCHRQVRPAVALAELRRCLRPGGVLVLNLPAYDWLKSAHDSRVHNARRFTRAEVRRLLAEAGLRPVWAGYWNTLLFPLMAARRLAARGDGAKSDVMPYPAPLDALFAGVAAFERWLIRRGARMPFGGSVIVVARKDVE